MLYLFQGAVYQIGSLHCSGCPLFVDKQVLGKRESTAVGVKLFFPVLLTNKY